MRAKAGLVLALLPASAASHPVHEVVQTAYLTLAPWEVRLELDLTPGLDVAPVLLRSLDADGNGHIADAEARAFAHTVLRQSVLSVDGAAMPMRLDRVSSPGVPALLSGGTLKIHARAHRPDRPGKRALSYRNGYSPVESRCTANIFLGPGKDWAIG